MNSTLVPGHSRDEAIRPMKVLLALIFLLPVAAVSGDFGALSSCEGKALGDCAEFFTGG